MNNKNYSNTKDHKNSIYNREQEILLSEEIARGKINNQDTFNKLVVNPIYKKKKEKIKSLIGKDKFGNMKVINNKTSKKKKDKYINITIDSFDNFCSYTNEDRDN